ncbi:MAG: TlpA family protein disulfide reductase, partial [Flavisolibacter sp.]
RDSSLCYQLYKLNDSSNKEIGKAIGAKAQLEYRYFNMQGKPLPEFHFVDLDGNVYDANTTKGKILVINCWFIHCKPCNEEIPALNRLVKQLKNRKDVLFVSLAFDGAEDLKKFLKRNVFEYAIVPNKENYLMNDLRIVEYPTHLIINRQGMIKKVIEGNMNNYHNVVNFISALNEEIKNDLNADR